MAHDHAGSDTRHRSSQNAVGILSCLNGEIDRRSQAIMSVPEAKQFAIPAEREDPCVQSAQLAALHPKAVPVEMSDERPVPEALAPPKRIAGSETSRAESPDPSGEDRDPGLRLKGGKRRTALGRHALAARFVGLPPWDLSRRIAKAPA